MLAHDKYKSYNKGDYARNSYAVAKEMLQKDFKGMGIMKV